MSLEGGPASTGRPKAEDMAGEKMEEGLSAANDNRNPAFAEAFADTLNNAANDNRSEVSRPSTNPEGDLINAGADAWGDVDEPAPKNVEVAGEKPVGEQEEVAEVEADPGVYELSKEEMVSPPSLSAFDQLSNLELSPETFSRLSSIIESQAAAVKGREGITGIELHPYVQAYEKARSALQDLEAALMGSEPTSTDEFPKLIAAFNVASKEYAEAYKTITNEPVIKSATLDEEWQRLGDAQARSEAIDVRTAEIETAAADFEADTKAGKALFMKEVAEIFKKGEKDAGWSGGWFRGGVKDVPYQKFLRENSKYPKVYDWVERLKSRASAFTPTPESATTVEQYVHDLCVAVAKAERVRQ